jgi:putative FmdB family regulatory protein
MPTYEYKCENCGNVFEEFQPITDEPLKKCPTCGGKVHRLIGAGAGLIFKGSGFYLTDYKKSNSSPASPNNDTKSGSAHKRSNEKASEKNEMTPGQKVEKPPVAKDAK